MFNMLRSASGERTSIFLAAGMLSAVCGWHQSAVAQAPTEAPTTPPEAEDVMPTAEGAPSEMPGEIPSETPGQATGETPSETSAETEPEDTAETTADEAAEVSSATVCSYDPSSGLSNPLGMRAFITVSEVDGDSVVRYEQFPSVVTAPEDVDRSATIASERSLTLYETPIAEARQLLIDFPDYYAALVGVTPEAVSDDTSFTSINETLTCQMVSDADAANVPQPSEPPASPAPTPEPEAPADATESEGETPADEMATLSDLPNGNYRFVSAEFPLRVVTDEELLESGGTIFAFRKFGEDVTGIFSYIDSEIGACVAGTLEGNTVTGQAFTNDEPVSAAESGEGADESTVFLGAGGFLQLGEEVAAERYDNSVLSLDGFSRINAGTQVPPESCL